MVVLVVVGFLYMSISMWLFFLMRSKSRKLILLLSSHVGLKVRFLCDLFIPVVKALGWISVWLYTIRISSTFQQ
jgi:hypothetical protein